jgi:hypothetical protein
MEYLIFSTRETIEVMALEDSQGELLKAGRLRMVALGFMFPIPTFEAGSENDQQKCGLACCANAEGDGSAKYLVLKNQRDGEN